MKKQLILVHGRAQQQKDSIALKAEWLDALNEGLAKSNLTLPIPEENIRFPFYGDTLYGMTAGQSSDEAAQIIVRGANTDEEEQQFIRSLLQEIREENDISDEQLAEIGGQDVVDRGPLNWEWFQTILQAIDRCIPFGSGTSIALFTNDVYQYLKNSVIRETIDTGVSAAITPNVETVVVAHSLGSIVAYNLLRQQGHLRGWKVPLFVTVGSPLAITLIRKTLRGFAPARCPECVTAWFNAMDNRDVVALYPLDTTNFPVNPSVPKIENKTDVQNKTTNRHGICGYLDDKEVAKRIYDALV